MEWLDEINAVAVTIGWIALLWSYLRARRFRRTFQEGEPGQRFLDILMQLFRFTVLFWSLSLPRVWLNLNRDPDLWRQVITLISVGIMAYLFVRTVVEIRKISKAQDAEDRQAAGYDPYEKPFGDL